MLLERPPQGLEPGDGREGGGGGGGGQTKKAPVRLLDCRNDYESKEGTFTGAEPLGTSTFSESWGVLREKLADVPRDTPIMTFCTGGIRCVKTNAFLEQVHPHVHAHVYVVHPHVHAHVYPQP